MRDQERSPEIVSALAWSKSGGTLSIASGQVLASEVERLEEALAVLGRQREEADGLIREAALVSSDDWDALDARMREYLEAREALRAEEKS